MLKELCRGVAFSGDLSCDTLALLRHHGKDGVADHICRVAALAGQIAPRAGVPIESAQTAAWLHDVSQVIPAEQMVDAALQFGITVLPEDRQTPVILHGRLSAVFAEAVFGVHDPLVLDAVRYHSTLRAHATTLDKVVLAADKLSWDPSDTPFYLPMAEALEQSLDDAIRCYIKWVFRKRNEQWVIHPWLRQAYADLCGTE